MNLITLWNAYNKAKERQERLLSNWDEWDTWLPRGDIRKICAGRKINKGANLIEHLVRRVTTLPPKGEQLLRQHRATPVLAPEGSVRAVECSVPRSSHGLG